MTVEEEFVHNVAVRLSRVLNLINPNDLLATRVIDIANANDQDGFSSGTWFCSYFFTHNETDTSRLLQAARAFGIGPAHDDFLKELHGDITSHTIHQRQEQSNLNAHSKTIAGVTVTDSETLEPEPVRQGGFLRNENEKQHVFKKPITANTAEKSSASLLGLDKLASEKRLADSQIDSKDEGSRKRQRSEGAGNGFTRIFKGEYYLDSTIL
jgi:pre-mRNA-splicing factor ATP-dependent RNA helicase DHX38/PRP16